MLNQIPEHLTIAHQLLEAGHYLKARSELEALHRSKPDDSNLLAMLAYATLACGDVEEGTNVLRESIGLKPQNDWRFFAQARELEQAGHFLPAREAIARAIEINPEQAKYYAVAANLELIVTNPAGALEFAEAGIQVDPDNLDCQNLRILAYEALHRTKTAQKAYEELIERRPNHAPSFANYGWFQLRTGKWSDALSSFGMALSIDGRDVAAAEGMVEALKYRYWPLRMLTYFLRMFAPTSKTKLAVMLGVGWGGYLLVFNSMHNVSVAAGNVANFMATIYWVFVYLSLAGEDLTNICALVFREGRMLLAKIYKISSLMFLLAPILAFGLLITGFQIEHFTMQVFGLSLLTSIFALMGSLFHIDRITRYVSIAASILAFVPVVLSVVFLGEHNDLTAYVPFWAAAFTIQAAVAAYRNR